MTNAIKKSSKKGLHASVTGTFFHVFCCFTSLLVLTLGVTGLAAFTPYLDYVLYPALAVMIFVTFSAYKKWKNGCKMCVADNNGK